MSTITTFSFHVKSNTFGAQREVLGFRLERENTISTTDLEFAVFHLQMFPGFLRILELLTGLEMVTCSIYPLVS